MKANQILHSTVASRYESDEPHFRLENRSKVKQRLEDVASLAPECRVMVDMGCGTGFLEELAPAQIERVIAVDVTDEMLAILKQKQLQRIEILAAQVEQIPLPNSVADLVTGYSVLDHFESPPKVFKEASRLLKSGGVFYMDLIPNSDFWNGLRSIDQSRGPFDPIVARELSEVARHGQKMSDNYGVDFQVLAAAEPHKEKLNGFNVSDLRTDLMQAGFTDIALHREWFLGEASVFHTKGPALAEQFKLHLQKLSPLTDHLFKYLWFTAIKA